MKATDRSLFDAFSADERTLPLRKLRSTLGIRFDEGLRLIHQLANGDESLTFNSIMEAKNGLLQAFQIRYSIKIACEKIYGHEQVVAKIQFDMDDKITKALAYMNEVNQWLARIEGSANTTAPNA
jgi:hypothetical protein